jgi:hypothetical protein
MSTMKPERLTAVTNLLNTTYGMNVSESDVATYLAVVENGYENHHPIWCNSVKVETIARTLANSIWGKDIAFNQAYARLTEWAMKESV